MIEVPIQFRPHIHLDYPVGNYLPFEEWLHQQNIPETNREYLPVFWTSFYVNNNYGKDIYANEELQFFLNGLDKSKKYFGICQYDDGILNDVSSLDLLQFSMSKNIGYPIPLLCHPHPYYFGDIERRFLGSFTGNKTHPIRESLFKLSHKPEYFISSNHYDIKEYCKLMAESIFNLAPRGYGLSSFRLYEGMQFGAIPVYISDEFIIPYNEPFDYGVLIEAKDADNIDDILKSISKEEIKFKQNRIKELYNTHFTFNGCKEKIFHHLLKEQ